MKINHFYDIIQYEVAAEEVAIPENLRVQEFVDEVVFNMDNAMDKQKVILKGLIASSEMQISEKTTFLKGKINIGSDVVDFKVWNNGGDAYMYADMFEKERFISFQGTINVYNGKKSIIINEATPLEVTSEALNYLPKVKESRTELIAELLFYIEQLSPNYKTIALQYLDKYGKHFFEAPAALGHHHNYIGGLLKHTVGLMRMAYFIKNYDDVVKASLFLYSKVSNIYINDVWSNYNGQDDMKRDFDVTWANSMDHLMNTTRSLARLSKAQEVINWDVVFTSIIFHDSGKILEYSYLGEDASKFKLLYPNCTVTEFIKGGISMDQLKGQSHIPLGAMILMDVINSSNVDFLDKEIAMMNNAIFAHHGKLEWGSPSVFEYPESAIVHIADLCDSRFEKDAISISKK